MIASRDNIKIFPSLPVVFASGVLTSDNTNVADGATVTIGSIIYRFKTTIVKANDVAIGLTADISLQNLANAINGTGNRGTDYFYTTVTHPLVSSGVVASNAITITAKLQGTDQNLIATTETSAHLSFGSSTLTGGIGGKMIGLTIAGAAAYISETIDVGPFIEMIGFVLVNSHSGTNPSLDIKLQFSPDGKNWMDSGDAFTQITTSDTLTLKRFTAIFGKYIRFVATVGGTNTPTYNLDLTIIAKA